MVFKLPANGVGECTHSSRWHTRQPEKPAECGRNRFQAAD